MKIQSVRYFTLIDFIRWCDNRNKTNSIKTFIFNHFILFDLLAYPHKYPQMSVCHTVVFFSGVQKYQVSAMISEIIPMASKATTGSNSCSHVHSAAKDFIGCIKVFIAELLYKEFASSSCLLRDRGISPAKNERIALSIISRVSTGSSTMICKPMPLR